MTSNKVTGINDLVLAAINRKMDMSNRDNSQEAALQIESFADNSKNDYFSKIPEELHRLVYKQLAVKDLMRLTSVSRQFILSIAQYLADDKNSRQFWITMQFNWYLKISDNRIFREVVSGTGRLKDARHINLKFHPLGVLKGSIAALDFLGSRTNILSLSISIYRLKLEYINTIIEKLKIIFEKNKNIIGTYAYLSEVEIPNEKIKEILSILPKNTYHLHFDGVKIENESVEHFKSHIHDSDAIQFSIKNSNISHEKIKCLLESIPKGIKYLNFSENSIDNELFLHIASKLPIGIEYLKIDGNQLTDINFDTLEKFPEKLKILSARSSQITIHGLKHLLKKLPPELSELKLDGNDIGTHDFHDGKIGFKIFEDFPAFPKGLQILNLDSNQLGAFFFLILINKLPEKLREFSLKRNQIDAEGFTALVKILPDSIRVLHLESNRILDGSLADFPAFPKGLELLNLASNQLGADFSKIIKNKLPGPLKILCLQNNEINAENFTALAKVLPNSIQILHLEYNQIGTGSLENLSAFSENLKFLNLRSNGLGAVSLQNLMNKLPNGLEELNLQDNEIDSEGFKILAKILPESIKKLYLDGNRIGEGSLEDSPALPKGLKVLTLCSNQLNATGLKNLIDKLPEDLEFLALDGNKIGDDVEKVSFKDLKPLPTRLKDISISRNGLIELKSIILMRALIFPNGFHNLKIDDEIYSYEIIKARQKIWWGPLKYFS